MSKVQKVRVGDVFSLIKMSILSSQQRREVVNNFQRVSKYFCNPDKLFQCQVRPGCTVKQLVIASFFSMLMLG